PTRRSSDLESEFRQTVQRNRYRASDSIRIEVLFLRSMRIQFVCAVGLLLAFCVEAQEAPAFPFGAVYFRKSNPPEQDWERDHKKAADMGMNIFRHWFMW